MNAMAKIETHGDYQVDDDVTRAQKRARIAERVDRNRTA